MVFLRLASVLALYLGLMAGMAWADCTAHFDRAWGNARVVVDSLGPDCNHAVLVLTVRDASGNALWASVHRTTDLMTFQNLPTLSPQKMAEELRAWVAPDKRWSSSANLPDWPQSASDRSLPPKAEFPFRVSEGLDRGAYLALRKAKLPILCFVTGMESQTCLALDKDNVTEIGTQSFPG